MTMATETENNAPAGETKDIKDVKDMKEALKDETPDNKQQQEETKEPAKEEKKDEAAAETPAPAPAKPVTVHKTNFEKDIVYLYQFPRTPLLPSLSPYCLKVETWLRLNGIKYEVSCNIPLSRSVFIFNELGVFPLFSYFFFSFFSFSPEYIHGRNTDSRGVGLRFYPSLPYSGTLARPCRKRSWRWTRKIDGICTRL